MVDQIDEPQADTNTDPYSAFERDLSDLINSHSIEQHSNTPDFILARHMVNSLKAFTEIMRDRISYFHGGNGKP